MNACAWASAQQEIGGKQNPSTDLNYELIAVEAADRGYINKTEVSRPSAVSQVVECAAKLPAIPLECMADSDLDFFLAQSLRIERELVHNFSRTNPHLEQLRAGEAAHREGFWNSSRHMCSANISAVMSDAGWLDCFRRIR